MSLPREPFEDCYWLLQDDVIIVGNTKCERSWLVTDKGLVGLSLRDVENGYEWFTRDNIVPSCRLPGMGKKQWFSKPTITAKVMDRLNTRYLQVTLEWFGAEWNVAYHICIFPYEGLLRQYWEMRVSENDDRSIVREAANPLAIKTMDRFALLSLSGDYTEVMPISPVHVKWQIVQLADGTDYCNNFVTERHGILFPHEKSAYEGNVLFCRDLLTEQGLYMLKEAPCGYSQVNYPGGDFKFQGNKIYLTGSGWMENEWADGICSYATVIGIWKGETFSRLKALHRYFEIVYPIKQGNAFFTMSNTWGDRSFDSKINETFIAKEIEQAAYLGIEIVQIDDGWQQGKTKNSSKGYGKWSNYYEGETNFWQPDESRFPHGFQPLVQKANRCGVSLGLWFSPDSHDDFKHWLRDADTVIHLFRMSGVRHFKLDGIHLRSRRGELRLQNFLAEVSERSDGEIVFQFDITDQRRLGFFGGFQQGTIFMENRFTEFGTYYTHWTLRNLWKSCRYYPSSRVVVEFLNVDRNLSSYRGSPLDPANVGMVYAFAVTLFANPLAWMELSELSGDLKDLKAMITLYKEMRSELSSPIILPIGEEPSGVSWTGFQSVSENGGYILLFREMTAAENKKIALWGLKCENKLELTEVAAWNGVKKELLLSGSKKRDQTDEDGKLNFQMNEPMSFRLYRYTTMLPMKEQFRPVH
ncbi:Melibiase [Paenibacillus sp. UNCCL117]|uniref:alpha-galactosidase n=1 Tax=unclassified Paenibacillus TaxID=185978 RepID=UPI00088F35BE|nr:MULTISPECIES: alpha-galactosidase [unclassified Paenibacillus]SDE61437.1 Melibiase [Paenibacillus sp. cl123]SFW69754.1 Melibiase [Paenibacillus sp. UNCCL117]